VCKCAKLISIAIALHVEDVFQHRLKPRNAHKASAFADSESEHDIEVMCGRSKGEFWPRRAAICVSLRRDRTSLFGTMIAIPASLYWRWSCCAEVCLIHSWCLEGSHRPEVAQPPSYVDILRLFTARYDFQEPPTIISKMNTANGRDVKSVGQRRNGVKFRPLWGRSSTRPR
jgi:hypothetical protein